MTRTITAIFDGEVFRPTEPVDLPADAAYCLTISDQPRDGLEESFPLRKYLDLAANLDVPSDLAAQHDHYLYGTPKR